MTNDELIEAMARAMFKPDQLNRLDIAKAMLAIARPIIERETRDKCAKVADSYDYVANSDAELRAVSDVCDAIAAAIRSDGDE